MPPFIFVLLLLFYVVFENICNVFAEITKLDHRYFYEDWWNSTTYEEFNRKWNRPVHIFLYRHVYLEMILRWGMKKKTAQMVTFLFSALKRKPEPRGLFINRMDKTADLVAKHSKSISYLIMEVFHKMEMNYIITLKSEIIILTFWQRSQCNIWNHL